VMAAQECDAALERLVAHLAQAKAVLTANVHAQLQSISLLQSKTRDQRCKLAALQEVGAACVARVVRKRRV
jgi:hypothetical protein